MLEISFLRPPLQGNKDLQSTTSNTVDLPRRAQYITETDTKAMSDER